MDCHSCYQTFKGFYDFVGFAQATGLKPPLISKAYMNFANFTISLMHEEQSYGFDGIITEAFELWSKQQTLYCLN